MIPLNNSGGQEPPGESASSSHELRAGKQRVLIIVPAYNEAGSLRTQRVGRLACDVVVIDDGSTDATRQCVANLARVISPPCNKVTS